MQDKGLEINLLLVKLKALFGDRPLRFHERRIWNSQKQRYKLQWMAEPDEDGVYFPMVQIKDWQVDYFLVLEVEIETARGGVTTTTAFTVAELHQMIRHNIINKVLADLAAG
jgi:hypothetical protein